MGVFEDAHVDVVVVHFITFALGTIVPTVAMRLRKPIIFWSEPEPPMTGGRIEANSFCAANMNAHALWKMGVPYSFVYGTPDTVSEELSEQFRAHACVKQLNGARIGVLGGRVPGFYTSDYDELRMRKIFGTEIECITLLELANKAEKVPDEKLAITQEEVKAGASCQVSEGAVLKTASLLSAVRTMTEQYRLDAWAVRCWPEFGDLFGVTACRILSCVTGSGKPSACEGDTYGALAMLVAQSMTDSDSFFCDMIAFDEQTNTGVFWHCGAAPHSLCDSCASPVLRQHSIIDGGDRKGIVSEFPLKPGQVTIMRIGENRERGYRMLSIAGEAMQTEQIVRGTPLQVRFKQPVRSVVDTLIQKGFEHHFILCYGDIQAELRTFSSLLNLDLIEF